MSIVFYCNWPNKQEWIQALKKKFVKENIYTWPKIKNKSKIECAIIWNMPRNELRKFKNLKIIFSMGAGVDHLFKDYKLPNLPIIRLKDPVMRKRMLNYVYCHILNYQINTFRYLNNKNKRLWSEEYDVLDNHNLKIGILGMGYLGYFIATNLNKSGYIVRGYQKTKKTKKYNFPVHYKKKDLIKFLSESDIVVNLLPNTKFTEDYIDKKFLNKMKKNSLLINVGRGSTVNEKDLISHMKINKNFKAVLDVFKEEPLKKEHKFWKEKNIFISPHIASITSVNSAVEQIYKNYKTYKKKNRINNKVNTIKQY